MASFVVLERRAPDGTVDCELVRDGFHLLAFLVPLVWFLFHRMWIEAAVALVLIVGLAVAASTAGYPAYWPLSLVLSIFAGLEAPALRLASLRRAGWHDWGVVEADDAFGAETRYKARADAGEHVVGTGPAQALAPAVRVDAARAARPAEGPALGLFSYPDGR